MLVVGRQFFSSGGRGVIGGTGHGGLQVVRSRHTSATTALNLSTVRAPGAESETVSVKLQMTDWPGNRMVPISAVHCNTGAELGGFRSVNPMI